MSIEQDFARAWPHLEPAVHLFKQHTAASVFNAIESGRSRLWLLPNSAAVSTLKKYPSGRKSFDAWLAGGDLDEIVEWVNGPAVEVARANRCNEMRAAGRRGWVRVLGWREASTVAIRDLDNA